MSHFLMSTVGAHGHVNPNLPVMSELVARGHRVSYTCPPPFASIVASSGSTPLVVHSDLPDADRGERWPTGGIPAMQLFLDEGRGVYPQLERLLDEDRPDAVLHDGTGWAGQAYAAVHGLPRLTLMPNVVAWEGYTEEMADAWAFLDEPDGVAWRTAFDEWLAAIRAGVRHHAFLNHPERCAVLIPAAMQPNLDRVDGSVYTFVGPVLDGRPHQEGWPAPGRPLVLVSLGSAYQGDAGFYRTVLDALADPRRELVMSTGPHVDPASLGPLPAHVTVRPWVPQLAVLAHASAFVTHAGMGGCSEGLFHGVPMVAIPQAVDQFGNADRLVELGVAEQLAMADATTERLSAAVRRVSTSPEVAARCADERARARRAGGAAAAADMAEDLLRR